MKRSIGFLVITLLAVLGCSAAFGEGIVNLGLMDNDGVTQLCDYLNFSYGTSLASGIHVNQLCPFDDETLIGVVVTIPKTTGLLVTGPVVVLADSGFDALLGFYTGIQVLLVTKTHASMTQFGWEFLYNDSDDFAIYLDNFGYLTKQLGPRAPLALGASQKNALGSLPRAHKLIKK
jgi:hypothetical protein